jgi:hypothetical protein
MAKHAGPLSMLAFIIVFAIATYAVSQLTTLAPLFLRGTASRPDVLIGLGYFIVTAASVLILGRMIYLSERGAGRVKRRVRLFE